MAEPSMIRRTELDQDELDALTARVMAQMRWRGPTIVVRTIITWTLRELPELRLGGLKEVAELTGVPRSTAQKRGDHGLVGHPTEVARVAAGGLYDLDAVERWVREGRGSAPG